MQQYAARLIKLATHSKFCKNLDTILRHKFIVGSGKIVDFTENETFTFQTALNITLATESPQCWNGVNTVTTNIKINHWIYNISEPGRELQKLKNRKFEKKEGLIR